MKDSEKSLTEGAGGTVGFSDMLMEICGRIAGLPLALGEWDIKDWLLRVRRDPRNCWGVVEPRQERRCGAGLQD